VIRKAILGVGVGLVCCSLTMAQAAVRPAGELAESLAQRLGKELHMKTAVGEAVKVGSVTLIPILMVDVNFAGAGVAGQPAGAPAPDGFLMSGEARPLGFVAVTKKGTRFISAITPPAK